MSRRSAVRPGAAREWRTPQHAAATGDFYRAVQEDVIAWWRAHHRTDLPWRPPLASYSPDGGTSVPARTPLYNPYEVWVSEVMSQQTRMETVIPYFKRWMGKFPTLEALAASTEEEVKSVWAGMGYYRRALYLHKGAQYVLEWRRQQHSSPTTAASASSPPTSSPPPSTTAEVPVMPSTQQELLKVPGIGPYTSAAVASLCFGEAVCSVDGNVIRVLSRLRGERDFDPKVPANVKRANEWGQALMGNTTETADVVCRDPSALNQGLMELGASVCRPGGAPLCASCPLQAHCCANALLQSGEIAAIEGVIPVRAVVAAKRMAKEVCVVHEVVPTEAAAAAEAEEADLQRRFVVVRRPSNGLLGGMLEFPTVSATTAETESSSAASSSLSFEEHPLCVLSSFRQQRQSKAKGGATTPFSVRHCGTVRHIFSHIDMVVEVVHVRWPAAIGGQDLLDAVSCVIDEHQADGEGNLFPAAARVSFMSEAELRSSAPSRLMLKVLHQVSGAEVKRKRAASPPTAKGTSKRTASATKASKRGI